VKVMLRPGVVREDFRVLPGRAGLAAMSMCVMLFSVVILPYAAGVAEALLVLGLVLHTVIAISALRIVLAGPEEARRVTPVMHLTFVGFIVAPLAALPLGMSALTDSILWYSVVAALLIWAAGLKPLLAGTAPPPLRPLQAIHLAPAAFIATVAHLAGQPALGNAFALFAVLLFVVLIARVRWLTAAGFSGFWSAFTFPLAAFAGMLFVVALGLGSETVRTLAGLALVLATLAIPPIAFKVIQLWARGTLAEKTNAARV
jgi:tellurite resistance protein